MQPTVRPHSGILIGLGAAAAAFGAFALMSTPTARADDYTDILTNVQSLLTHGQADFVAAEADFATGTAGVPDGLAAFFDGVDNDLVAAPDQVFVGLVEAASGDPVTSLGNTDLSAEANLTDALADAQTTLTQGETFFENLPTALSMGEYAQAAVDLIAPSLADDVAGEQVLMGAIDQLLGV